MYDVDGDDLFFCPAHAFYSGRVEVIIVTGAWYNACGHALLHIIGFGYVHISKFSSHPKILKSDSEFERYINLYGKRILKRLTYSLPSPEKANRILCEIMNERWQHGILLHNCATFVREILHAGGILTDRPGNCPLYTVLGIDSPSEAIERERRRAMERERTWLTL